MGLADTFDTAVIGGGVSGSATLVALHQQAGPDFRVALFDPRRPGPGSAYADQPARLAMNGPVRAMSIVADDDRHLYRWLDGSEELHALISRTRYGEYVAQTMQAILSERPRFEYYAKEIVDVKPVEDTYLLTAADGTTYHARAVVFALGNPSPDDRFLPREVRAHRGYFGDPWHFDVAGISGDVAIVGSRLTAMDVLCVLEEDGFCGNVTLISRHGILAELEDARVRGLDHTTLALETSSPYALFRSLRRAARAHVATGGDWRAIVESIRPISPDIWLAWNHRERRRFLRHLQSIWMAHRYRVPESTYKAYQRLSQDGRVRIVRGTISSAQTATDGTLHMTVTRAGAATQIAASTVINATGPNGDYAHLDRPLVRNAIERGIFRPDALRLGIDTSRDLELIARNGDVQPRLFALGPPLRGTFYECTAIPEIRGAARKIATALTDMHARRELGAAS